MSATVTPEEWRWRAWHLGEGAYKPYGRRNPAYRSRTGAPTRIPDDWWARFEEFLSARTEDKEKPPAPPSYPISGRASEHFRISEFDCHNGAKVPTAAYDALARLADVFLEELRSEFGSVYVTSGYRPRAYNASIGGAQRSAHIYDEHPRVVASDVIPKIGSPTQWARFLREIADKAKMGGVGRYPAFVHVDNGTRRDW